jgi:hypothetical protein
MIRIAMWSGPRNISTAMMRAWGNRSDTFVCDEPLYAHYLLKTGLQHPGAEEVISQHEMDWRKVVAWLARGTPALRAGSIEDAAVAPRLHTPGSESRGTDTTIFYQKHMAHHLLPEIERGWLDELAHAFLIRDPREMLPSLVKHLPDPTLRDTGLPQQVEIFEHVWRTSGRVPPVIDARDVLEDPHRMLNLLCETLRVPFDEAMLRWPAGPRDTDGVWAKHWYASVERSTTFEPYKPKDEPVPDHLQPLLRECMRHYERLHAMRLH